VVNTHPTMTGKLRAAIDTCSPGVSYGVNQLPSTLDNKYESGKAYSSCDQIEVFDFANHQGATYACGASCSSFYALNKDVTSWRVRD